ACALPQPPAALKAVSLGNDRYAIVAMLRAWAGAPAAIAAIDPSPLIAGAGDAGGGVTPGSLTPCKVLGATALAPSVPPTFTPGPFGQDGVPYVDGGVDISDAGPALVGTCGTAAPDGGAGAGTGDAGLPIAVLPGSEPHPTNMVVRDDAPIAY